MTLQICPLLLQARQHSQAVAMLTPNGTITYDEFNQRVNALACALYQQHIYQHSRVAICLANTDFHITLLWALWRLGAVACILSPRLPNVVLATQAQYLRCDYWISEIVLDKDLIERMVVSIDVPHLVKSMQTDGDAFHQDGYALNQINTIIFTSGTTAQPKAVAHSWGNHYFSALGANEIMPLNIGDRWLLSLPLYHVGGLGIMLRTILAGATLVLARWNEKDMASLIDKYQLTHLSLVPTQLRRLLVSLSKQSKDISMLKMLLIGGASCAVSLLDEALRKNLPIFVTYGLTEMTSQVATSKVTILNKETFMQAEVLPYRRIKISAEGEIYVKGQTLCQGYVQVDGTYQRPVDTNGWFATGDLGHCADGHYLSIYGRKDNMFISGGENIQPEEIERCLEKIEGVDQAIVMAWPDDEFGHRPIAVLCLASNCQMTQNILKKVLTSQLPAFKIPIQFYAWIPIEEKVALKVQRKNLLNGLQEGDKSFIKIIT